MSSLIDVKASEEKAEVAFPAKHLKQNSSSFLRTWGPSLLAIFGVLALNAALLGPYGSKVPALAERHLLKQKLSVVRTAAVLKMEVDEASDRKRRGRSLRSFAARNLSEEEGGVLEYTRRRHRYLGEYVHVDVSDQFSAFGKWTTTIIYFACKLVLLSILNERKQVVYVVPVV